MSSVLLRSGSLKDFHALGAVGNPVYSAASQLRAAMRRQLGPDVADLFAIPKQNETGDSIDWYAPVAGDIVPWSAATPEEQSEAKTALLDARQRLSEKSQDLQGHEDGERQVFGKLLAQVTNIPSDDHVYLVNGKPVVTFWGFTERNAPSGHDVLGGLDVAPLAPAAVAAVPANENPMETAPVVVEQERRPRPWWWWLLLIPLLLLLLALLLFGLRSCGFHVPLVSWMGFPPDETPAVIVQEQEPGVEIVEPEDPRRPVETVPGRVIDGSGVVVRDDGSVVSEDGAVPAVPGTVDEGVVPSEGLDSEALTEDLQLTEPPTLPTEEVPGEEIPGLEVPGEELPGEEVVPPAPEDTTLPATNEPVPPPGEEQTPPTDESQVSPSLPEGDQVPPGTTTPPAVPLKIPPEAVQDGSTKFLDGQWKSKTGLQDSETGQPIQLEYDFKDGEGTATLRHGASQQKCRAPVRSSMKGGKLVVEGTADFVCPDGTVIKQSNVECSVGADGRADCRGANEDGSSYGVKIVK